VQPKGEEGGKTHVQRLLERRTRCQAQLLRHLGSLREVSATFEEMQSKKEELVGSLNFFHEQSQTNIHNQ